MNLENIEKNLLAISIEAANDQIELLIFEFNELTEIFETKAKYSFEEINKKRGGFNFQNQGLKIYSKNNKIIAAAYQNYIGILTYDEKNDLIIYEKEILLGEFFGDVTFDDNGKYFFVICNNQDSNKIIYKSLARIDFFKYEMNEVKICVGENNDQLVIKNVWLNFDYLLYFCDQNARLETINFDKKEKKEKKEKNEKNSFLLNEGGLITNCYFFNEFLLIGFDDGKIMLYNRFQMQNQMSGLHTYHFPQINDSVYWEMWFSKHDLFCLVCMSNEFRVYSLEYEKNEAGDLSITDSFPKDSILTVKLMNGIIDSTVIRNGDNSRIVCLLNANNFQSKHEISLKEIDFGLKPLTSLNVELDFGDARCQEFEKFCIFEKKDQLIMFFLINNEIKVFIYINQLLMKQLVFKEFAKVASSGKFKYIFQINYDFLCFVSTDSFYFLKIEDDFSKNSMFYEEKMNSKIKLFKKIVPFDNQFFLVFLMEDNKLILQEFLIENHKIIKKGNYSRKMEKKQNQNLFLFSSSIQLSIILTFFDQDSDILNFTYHEKKINDIVSSFLPEISIHSLEILIIESKTIIFISTYNGELLVYINFETHYKLLRKWKFDNADLFQLKIRNAKSLYFYSNYETYILESYSIEDSYNIRCIKVLFDLEKQPSYIVYNMSNDQEICVKGKEIIFCSLNSDFKKRLIPEAHDSFINVNCEMAEKKILISGPKKKKSVKLGKFQKFRRLCYSEKMKVLLIISNNLVIITYDPFVYKFQRSFDLKDDFFKKLYDDYGLNMFKMITFPVGLELLCISSTTKVKTSETDVKEEEELTYRMNFCQLATTKNVYLEDPGYEIKLASEQCIKKKNDQIMDIVFLFDLEVFVIAIGGALEVYSFDLKNDENINFNFSLVLEYKIGKKIICLDIADKNMVLVGDYTKSLYVFRLEKIMAGNEKLSYKFILIRAEKEQRLLSTCKILDSATIMGIDKYGDCFITKINNNEYADCNNNAINYALISFRDSSRNILKLNKKFNYVREVDLNDIVEVESNESEENAYILVPTLMGGLHQIKFVNLVYLLDNEEINGFVENFTSFLMEQKSLKMSVNKNNLVNYLSIAKPTQKFIRSEIINEFLDENNMMQQKLIEVFYFCNQMASKKSSVFATNEIILALKELRKI